jgi:hypothetical protein
VLNPTDTTIESFADTGEMLAPSPTKISKQHSIMSKMLSKI